MGWQRSPGCTLRTRTVTAEAFLPGNLLFVFRIDTLPILYLCNIFFLLSSLSQKMSRTWFSRVHEAHGRGLTFRSRPSPNVPKILSCMTLWRERPSGEYASMARQDMSSQIARRKMVWTRRSSVSAPRALAASLGSPSSRCARRSA